MSQRRIQGADVKRDVDVGSIDRLIQDDSIYVAANSINKTLRDAITDGDIGGGSGAGGGDGSVNIIGYDATWVLASEDDRNAETTVGNWLAYADAAGVAPVDMTGGSPNTTITRTTTAGELLDGVGSFKMTVNSGASRQGEGVSLLCYVPRGYRGRTMTFKFPFYIFSGTVIEDDFRIYGYAVDGASAGVITPFMDTKIFGTQGVMSCQMAVPSDCTQLRVGIHIARVSTGAVTLLFDDVQLQPEVQPLGLAGSGWINDDSIVDPQGVGTVTNKSIWWRRVGDSIQIRGWYQNGTLAAATASLNVTYKIDTAKYSARTHQLGLLSIQRAGANSDIFTNNNAAILFYDGSDNDTVYLGTQGGSSALQKRNANAFMTNSDGISFEMTYPVLGWTSNVSIQDMTVYRMSSILANGTRVTGADPTRLGEYRSQLRNAGAGTFTDTNGAPGTAPNATDGIRVYGGNAYANADTNNEPSRYDIFIGKFKVYQIQWFASTGFSGFIDTTPNAAGSFLNANGFLTHYNPNTGVLTWFPGYPAGGGTQHTSGFIAPNSFQDDCYADIIVADDPKTLLANLIRSEVQVSVGNGFGATNTRFRRFSSTNYNAGSAVTYADDANGGASFTLNEDGIYTADFSDYSSAGGFDVAITRNDTQGTTNIGGTTAANVLAVSSGLTSMAASCSATFVGRRGDVIRAKAVNTNASDYYVRFRIAKVSQ